MNLQFMNNKIIVELKKVLFLMLTFSAIASLIYISSWWSTFNQKMIIKRIIFSETKILESHHYSNLLDEYLGKNLDKTNLKVISNNIENHPYIQAARVSKKYPSKIKVEVIEREPIAILQIDPMVLLDKEGYVLPDAGNLKNYNVPIMTNFNTENNLYPPGEKAMSLNVKKCIYWLNKIKKHYYSLYENLSEMKMTANNEMQLILSEQPTHIYLGVDEIWMRLNTLKNFETKLNHKKLSDFNYLDMRYDNQIIVKSRSL